MATETLYVRMPVDVTDWLKKVAKDSNISMAKVAEALLREWMRKGLTRVELTTVTTTDVS